MAALRVGGPWLYSRMGGTGLALEAAPTHSNWVFAGAVLVWVFNSLSAVICGSGNMAVPTFVSVAGTVVLIPLSPLLIFGCGAAAGAGRCRRGAGLAVLLSGGQRGASRLPVVGPQRVAPGVARRELPLAALSRHPAC